jgi:hypothetical protein
MALLKSISIYFEALCFFLVLVLAVRAIIDMRGDR